MEDFRFDDPLHDLESLPWAETVLDYLNYLGLNGGDEVVEVMAKVKVGAYMDSEVWIGFVRRYKGYRDPLVLKFILELIGEEAVAVVVG